MLKNYLKVVFRNIIRNKAYSFISIIGLAVGFAGFILISVLIKNELSFDTFNKKVNRIYRVVEIQDFPGTGKQKDAITMGPLAPALKNYFSQIESSARIASPGKSLCKIGDKEFYEKFTSFADPSIFNIFTFPLIEGDPNNALNDPYSIVITESIAKKYFGNVNPLGKNVIVDYGRGSRNYLITGVMKDCPQNSHIYFEILGSYKTLEKSENWLKSWGSNGLATYILLRKNVSGNEINEQLSEFIRKDVPNGIWEDLQMYLQPIADIHLYSNDIPYQAYNYNEGSIYMVGIFSIIVLFIILIASINYMNLSTARSTKRIKEIGIRKVLGSTRRKLVFQFIGESVIISISAFLISLLIVEIVFPYFKNIFQERIIFTYEDSLSFLLELFGITIIVGVFAGSYPALLLSGFQPAQTLKGEILLKIKGSLSRRILVVLQFSLAVVLIVCTEIVSNQMSYMQNKNLGFNKEQMLYIPIRSKSALDKISLLKEELLQNPDIVSVAAGSGPSGASDNEGTEIVAGTNGQVKLAMTRSFIDFDFIKTMGMQIVKGRNFSPYIASDSSGVIINEEAAAKLGWKDPIGRQFEGNPNYTVIGMVKNFNFSNLHKKIEPLIMKIVPDRFEYVLIRLKMADAKEIVSFINSTWKKIVPGEPFDYSFLDQYFDQMYRNDRRTGQIFEFFSSLAIFIACLGLLGLASFTAEQRTKEIGVRKVLGATIPEIVFLLSKEFTKWVIIANLIAWPAAYYAMNYWLNDFAYRIDINWRVFILAGGLTLTIALATVSIQVIKAATANPVKSLKYE